MDHERAFDVAVKYLEERRFNDALRYACLSQKQGHDRVKILQLVANIKVEMNLPGDVTIF